MKLYQYIPPRSCHPPGMMEGIIYSLMRTYKKQNTKASDYRLMATKLFRRHVARGWDKNVMKTYILKADSKLNNAHQQRAQVPTQHLSNKERLFLHLEYHSGDIPKRTVRALYDTYCKPVFECLLGVKQFTIAYSRAKNLKDTLTQAKFHQAPGKPASKYYLGELIHK